MAAKIRPMVSVMDLTGTKAETKFNTQVEIKKLTRLNRQILKEYRLSASLDGGIIGNGARGKKGSEVTGENAGATGGGGPGSTWGESWSRDGTEMVSIVWEGFSAIACGNLEA